MGALHDLPVPELVFQAQIVHREHHPKNQVQLCTLLNIKTGGCPEDCAYCPQSARYSTGIEAQKLMAVSEVVEAAQRAKAAGSSRFCMGAAWRQVRDNADFENVLQMVTEVGALGLEVCTTLGMLTEEQAHRLADAGLTAYNHNLDTGPEHYKDIISTRQYQDRLNTLQAVRQSGVSVCCGGIIGMGERVEDRLDLLVTLANMDPQPESVPVNALVSVAGTPLGGRPPVDTIAMVRMIACARISMPKARVRLSAGRQGMSDADQALCFMAGANSIFTGEKLLTTPNPSHHEDTQMLARLGMTPAQQTASERA